MDLNDVIELIGQDEYGRLSAEAYRAAPDTGKHIAAGFHIDSISMASSTKGRPGGCWVGCSWILMLRTLNC